MHGMVLSTDEIRARIRIVTGWTVHNAHGNCLLIGNEIGLLLFCSVFRLGTKADSVHFCKHVLFLKFLQDFDFSCCKTSVICVVVYFDLLIASLGQVRWILV